MQIAPGSIHGIQLDLKYHMPNKRYMLDWLKRLPGYGINTLLVEYEDKFPFRKYPFLCDADAFTEAELTEFLKTARGAGLQVIPLIQSLSHFEFALEHAQLAHLREAPNVPTMVCPAKPESVEFIKDLYREVLEFHRDDPLFHLGGDETWFLGTCETCKPRFEADGPIAMWAEHLRKLLDFVIAAGKRPIVWDDIFWKDPEAIRRANLPKQTILHSWNYNITSLMKKDAGDGKDLEFGGAADRLRQVDVYKAAGYDSVAGPCYNYGQLFARHSVSLKNTAVWAQKVRQAGMLGMLNTNWAVFHIPQQPLNILVAATGELCANPDTDVVGGAWQQAWLEKEFGVPAEGVPEAFETLGRLWEIPMPSYGRSFTPIVYCYMNMVLHYPGRQEERRRRGAYPVDWSEIDFSEVYRKGVEESGQGDRAKVYERLDEILATYPHARDAMRRLAEKATRHKDEAEMLAIFADMKLLSARIFSHLLRQDGDTHLLRGELQRLKKPMQLALSLAWEPVGAERMMRAFWQPAYDALG